MTDYEELSKRVAELYGIDANSERVQLGFKSIPTGTWLHDDSARCFELACEHELDINPHRFNGIVEAIDCDTCSGINDDLEYLDAHNNDKALATRIAILKCLVKMKE